MGTEGAEITPSPEIPRQQVPRARKAGRASPAGHSWTVPASTSGQGIGVHKAQALLGDQAWHLLLPAVKESTEASAVGHLAVQTT